MGKNTCDKAVSLLGKLFISIGVKENIFSVLEQGHIRMHAGAAYTVNGLRHKCGVKAVLLRNCLNRHLKCHNIVRGCQRLRVFEVDFVLSCGYLMVRSLYFKAHCLKCEARLTSCAFAVVKGTKVKVARLIVCLCGRFSLVIGLEKEELKLRPYIKGITHISRPFKHLFKSSSRVPDKGCSIGIMYVADKPCYLAVLRSPGEHCKCVEVGIQVLVGLLNTHKALN